MLRNIQINATNSDNQSVHKSGDTGPKNLCENANSR